MTTTPFTLPHFKAWAHGLVLDSGEHWEVERFQAEFVRDLFRGYLEAWLVIPEGNAKTTLAAAVALYHARFTNDAVVLIAAASREQAMWLYHAAAGFVERSEAIRGEFRCQEGYRRIRCDRMGSRLQVFAADDRTGDGARPTLAILEELHRHRDLRLYRTWRGKIEKRGGQLVAISTAGDPDGEFEQVRARMRSESTESRRKGGFLRAASADHVLHEYSVPENRNPENMRDVKMANPLAAITVPMLKRKFDSPAMTMGHWLRFACGRPAGLDDQPIRPEEWDRLRVDIGRLEDGETVILVPSVGHVGVVGIAASRPEGRTAVGVRVVESANPPPYVETEQLLRELCERYDVIGVYHPVGGFTRSAELLESEGYPMQKAPQSPVGIAAASGTFNRMLRGGLLMHDGDTVLRNHVLTATMKTTEIGERYEITDHSRALIAVAMGVHAITAWDPEPYVGLPSEGIG